MDQSEEELLTEQVQARAANTRVQIGAMPAWKIVTQKLATREQLEQTAQALASSSEELTNVSQKMVSNAEETWAQANVVSAAAEEVSKNLQTVATGSDEMSASIAEIGKVITVIASIALQTNLLALNATIAAGPRCTTRIEAAARTVATW